MKLKEKVALVTGAAQELGKAIALAIAKEGAEVVVCDNKAPPGHVDSRAKSRTSVDPAPRSDGGVGRPATADTPLRVICGGGRAGRYLLD